MKMYYSIKEVALELGESEPTLRYWEKEFQDVISPRRNENGVRFYTEKDMEDVRLVRHLIRENGLTLEGARKKLKNNKELAVKHAKALRHLRHIKAELKILSEAMNEAKRIYSATLDTD